MNAHDLFESGMQFHGHKCPAMPMGLRAALAALDALGVERSQDKELHVLSETGADPLVDKILGLPDENFLDISTIKQVDVPQGKGTFEAQLCAKCGEMTSTNKLQETADGQVCIPCAEV